MCTVCERLELQQAIKDYYPGAPKKISNLQLRELCLKVAFGHPKKIFSELMSDHKQFSTAYYQNKKTGLKIFTATLVRIIETTAVIALCTALFIRHLSSAAFYPYISIKPDKAKVGFFV